MVNTSRCILIVEDDPIIQALVHQGLGSAGYETLTAGSGEALFDILEKEKDRVDLILLDLGLPDGDALPHIVDIRKITSKPIVVLTGRERIDDRLMALGLGADDYMTKPVDIRELVLRVGNIISRRGDGPAPSGAPIVVDGNRIKNPPKSAPQKKEKSRSPMLVGALVLIGVSIGGAGTYFLTTQNMSTPPATTTSTQQQTETVASAPAAPAPDASAPPAPSTDNTTSSTSTSSAATTSQPTTGTTTTSQTTDDTRRPVSSVAETVVVTEQTDTGGSRSVITSAPETTQTASVPEVGNVLNTRTKAEALGIQWVLNSRCGRVPQVDWWKYKTHADIAEYVVRRHTGNWEPFIDDLVRRLAKMYDIAERGAAAVTPDGDRMEGDDLEAYIEKSVARLQVARCLAKEAELASATGQ